jgi:hypothetical protein
LSLLLSGNICADQYRAASGEHDNLRQHRDKLFDLAQNVIAANHGFLLSSKMSSMRSLKSRAALKASGRLGSYFSVSMALTVCRETPSLSARSDCDFLE